MIVIPLNAAAYRVHHPKWSFAPTSGAGAGAHGGRANRPGLNALYLSLELETALAEYQQLDALMPPGLMVILDSMITRNRPMCQKIVQRRIFHSKTKG